MSKNFVRDNGVVNGVVVLILAAELRVQLWHMIQFRNKKGAVKVGKRGAFLGTFRFIGLYKKVLYTTVSSVLLQSAFSGE